MQLFEHRIACEFDLKASRSLGELEFAAVAGIELEQINIQRFAKIGLNSVNRQALELAFELQRQRCERELSTQVDLRRITGDFGQPCSVGLALRQVQTQANRNGLFPQLTA